MDDAKALFERAKALHQQRQIDGAIELYRRAIAEKPDYAEAHNNLGNALGTARRFDEAVASLRRATELRPELAAIHSNLGLALLKLDRFEEAETSLRRALELQSDFAPGHMNLAMALGKRDKWNEAIDHFRRAAALTPGAPECHLSLGAALMEVERPKEAIESFRRAVELAPTLARAHLAFADALHDVGDFEEAQAAYARAIELDDKFARAYFNRGRALLELGRKSEALDSLDRAIALEPLAGAPHFYRLRAIGGKPLEGDIVRLESAVAAAPERLPAQERSMFHAALAAAYEALGRFDEAFDHAGTANRLRRPQIKYDEPALARRLERVREVFTPELLAGKSGSGSDSELPIFVVGAPRSGSTLIEQILASHRQVQGGGERARLEKLLRSVVLPDGSTPGFPDLVPSLLPRDLRLLGDTYVMRLGEGMPPASRIVDKYLDNYIYIGLIHLILPKARILHALRDPLDACVSAYFLSFAGNAQPQSYDLGELGRHYRLYAALMDHWRRVLPAGVVLDVRYETLVEDFEPAVRRLLDFCGLPWDARCLSFHETRHRAQTASMGQINQKLYATSIGRWRRYEAHLGPLIEALGEDAGWHKS